ncbi:hypothetical protein BCON_0005g00330 [Botryotinia convoluta]|uniref:Uncharacterized protein n=1 Tax=Botryotinia convoluta TaxID=54673 RepID=A0A4Z1IU14_9HELO|nr:hypothetical protein BCON_0005g00330 [Botryotinia convoluta]
MVSALSILGVSEVAPVQCYFNYTLPSNSSSLPYSTASDERQKSDEILYKERQHLRWMMILFNLKFILNAIKLCFMIRNDREKRMRQDGAAAIRDLQEKIRSELKEKGSLGLHLDTIEGITWDDGKKDCV